MPDSDNYDVSWTDFNTEKLENYNWNYVDQYVCTRGEDDFGLMDVGTAIYLIIFFFSLSIDLMIGPLWIPSEL